MVTHDEPLKQVCRAHPTDTQTAQSSRRKVVHAPSSLAHLTHQAPSPADAWSQMGQEGPGTSSSEPAQPARNLQQCGPKGHCCPSEAGVGNGTKRSLLRRNSVAATIVGWLPAQENQASVKERAGSQQPDSAVSMCNT